MPSAEQPRPKWSLTTPHARVLMCIAADNTVRVRDISATTGLALRTVQSILGQLEADGALERRRNGRRNVYRIIGNYRPTDPVESGARLQDWIDSWALSMQADHSIGPVDRSVG